MFVLGGGYDDKAKIFCRGFTTIESLYITLYRSDVRELFYVGEQMRV